MEMLNLGSIAGPRYKTPAILEEFSSVATLGLLDSLVACRKKFQTQSVDLDETCGIFLVICTGVVLEGHMLLGVKRVF